MKTCAFLRGNLTETIKKSSDFLNKNEWLRTLLHWKDIHAPCRFTFEMSHIFICNFNVLTTQRLKKGNWFISKCTHISTLISFTAYISSRLSLLISLVLYRIYGKLCIVTWNLYINKIWFYKWPLANLLDALLCLQGTLFETRKKSKMDDETLKFIRQKRPHLQCKSRKTDTEKGMYKRSLIW